MKNIPIILLLFISGIAAAQKNDKRPVPSPQQLAWHENEFYLFIHFGPNTFTGKEWGEGSEHAGIFNPTALDCRQWCDVAKKAGAKGIIITAKHHDGFCLWPSKYSTHTVRESNWRNGKGDVLKELSEACRESGLKFGVYLSPWDRNHPDYGTEKYNDVFIGMMKEIFRDYGPVWELWWDGANGEGPNGKKQVYDWNGYRETVKIFSPNTVVFSDVGPHIRWVGNEKGIAGKTNWNYLDTAGFTAGLGAPPIDTLTHGNVNGSAWIPAECDVSIRPGWFYRSSEDEKVKTPFQLFELYLKSVGRGANFLLNIPPDQRGLIHPEDSAAIVNFNWLKTAAFKVDLAKQAKAKFNAAGVLVNAPELTDGFQSTSHEIVPGIEQLFRIEFDTKTTLNCISLMENIRYGQSVKQFEILFWNGNKVTGSIFGTTIGRKRILTFPEKTVTAFSVVIHQAKGKAMISEVSSYYMEPILIEPEE